MFSVILLSDQAERLFDRWREVFKRCEDQGSVAFCRWHQGDSVNGLERAVPDLGKTIKGKDEWRAIVVGTGVEDLTNSDHLLRDNPFDFERAHPISPSATTIEALPVARSSFPLVRLTHMLMGFPELGPKGFQVDPSFRDRETGETRYLSEFMVGAHTEGEQQSAREAFRAAQSQGHKANLHYRVVEANGQERTLHALLSREYEAQQPRPFEVIAVATRTPQSDNLRNDLWTAWRSRENLQASRFVERNNYPASCRFLAFDMKPRGHAATDLEELRFVTGVLTLALNGVPSSGLQSDRLYRLDVHFDDARLANFVNRHLGDLVDLREYLNSCLEGLDRPPRPSDVAIIEDLTISIDQERLQGDSLRVSESGYQLATDRPSSELERWQSSSRALHGAAARFVREPVRALNGAVREARSKMTRVTNAAPLSEIEAAELEEELAKRSSNLVRRLASPNDDAQSLKSVIEQHDRRIRREIVDRLTGHWIVLITAVAVGAWLAALLPYLIRSYFRGFQSLGEGFLLTVAILGLLLLVILMALLYMRHQLITLIRRTNSDMRAYARVVNANAQAYAAFLSQLVTYAVAKRRLLQQQLRVRREKQERRSLKRLVQEIDAKIELEKSLVNSVGRPLQIQPGNHVGLSLAGHGLAYAQRIVLWEPESQPCEFNNSGEEINAPYPFISQFIVQSLTVSESGEVDVAHPQNRDVP